MPRSGRVVDLGEFRAAMPATDWERLVELWDDNWHGDDTPIPPDHSPFTPGDVHWGDGGDYYISPWLPLVVRYWFPQDFIDKYGGHVEWANANYDQLYLPPEAADDIAEELRARGHRVEKTFTGDLNYWLEWRGGPPVSEGDEDTEANNTGSGDNMSEQHEFVVNGIAYLLVRRP
jgi:hypothetical protein